MSEMIERVTQADRDAAVAYAVVERMPWSDKDAKRVLGGKRDYYELVQAFAAHRIAALQALMPPTEGMIEAGARRHYLWGGEHTVGAHNARRNVKEILAAMLSAALSGEGG